MIPTLQTHLCTQLLCPLGSERQCHLRVFLLRRVLVDNHDDSPSIGGACVDTTWKWCCPCVPLYEQAKVHFLSTLRVLPPQPNSLCVVLTRLLRLSWWNTCKGITFTWAPVSSLKLTGIFLLPISMTLD